jgi:hypothetical protein
MSVSSWASWCRGYRIRTSHLFSNPYEEWGKPDEAAKWRAELAGKPPAENNEAKP